MAQEDSNEFIAAWNDLTGFPTVADVAIALGISYQTARNRATILRAVHRNDPSAPAIIMRKPGAVGAPKSESFEQAEKTVKKAPKKTS